MSDPDRLDLRQRANQWIQESMEPVHAPYGVTIVRDLLGALEEAQQQRDEQFVYASKYAQTLADSRTRLQEAEAAQQRAEQERDDLKRLCSHYEIKLAESVGHRPAWMGLRNARKWSPCGDNAMPDPLDLARRAEQIRALARTFAAEWLRPSDPDHATPALLDTLTTTLVTFESVSRRDLLAALEEAQQQLAECLRQSGADPDGNEDWRLARHAVEEVTRLRKDYEDLVSQEVAEARAAQQRAEQERLARIEAEAEYARQHGTEESDAAFLLRDNARLRACLQQIRHLPRHGCVARKRA